MQLPNRWAVILLVMVSLLFVHCDTQQQISASDQLKPFYGTFKGSGETVGKGEIAERDLTVTIKPWEDKGFTVDWSTIIYRDGREKKTNMSIDFYQSPRPGIFASAMRVDVFGNTVPYNPVDEQANPYVWAGLKGDTLTVTALYITDGGEHEVQVYRRTLHENGLALEFERLKNGVKTTEISAMLAPATL